MASEAQKRATRNYEKNSIDKLTLRLPKGKKEQINKALKDGESVNSFIISAVDEKLERLNGVEPAKTLKSKPASTQEPPMRRPPVIDSDEEEDVMDLLK